IWTNTQPTLVQRLVPAIGKNAKQRPRISIVAESLIDVNEQVAIPRGKDETGAKLEGILSKPVLPESCGPGNRACLTVVPAEDVKQVRRVQLCSSVSSPFGIDQ